MGLRSESRRLGREDAIRRLQAAGRAGHRRLPDRGSQAARTPGRQTGGQQAGRGGGADDQP
eukprot:1332657-Alexandrium_andersonii.AAC.1